MLQQLVIAVFVGVFASLCYYNAKDCDFVFDDHLAIRTNADVSGSESVFSAKGLFFHDFWGRDFSSENNHKSYRPLTILTFRLNHYFHEYNAYYYHVVNILLHGLVSALVVALVFLLLNGHARAHEVALMSGLLFACHPVHVEAVTVGRAELLCAIFVLIGFYFGVVGSRLEHVPHDASQMLPSDLRFYLVLTSNALMTVCTILAVLSKEVGLCVLPFIGFYDLLTFALPAIESAYRESKKLTEIGKKLIYFIIRSLYLVALLIRAVLMSRGKDSVNFKHATLSGSRLLRKTENPLLFTEGISYVLSLFYIHFYNFWLLVFPAELSAEYSFDCIPMVKSLSDVRNVVTFLFLVALLGFFLFAIVRRKSVVLFVALWVLVSYLPVSHLLAIAAMFLSQLPDWLSENFPSLDKKQLRRIVYCAFVVIISLCVMKTYLRTEDWRTDVTIFESAVHVCPRSAKMHMQMAMSHLDDFRLCLKHINIAEGIDPDFCDLSHAKGNCYLRHHDYGNAFAQMKKNLHCPYTSPKAMEIINELLNLYLKQPNISAFIDAGDVTVILRSEDAPGSAVYAKKSAEIVKFYREAGSLLYKEKKFQRALEILNRGHELGDPTRCDLYYWKGKTYCDMAQHLKVKKDLRQQYLLNCTVNFYAGMMCEGESKEEAGPVCFYELYKMLTDGETRVILEASGLFTKYSQDADAFGRAHFPDKYGNRVPRAKPSQ